MDDADRADDRIQRMIDEGIARVRARKHLQSIGACHYCAEPLTNGRLFCSKECSDNYAHEQERKAANGNA